jgi:hypothetical protein
VSLTVLATTGSVPGQDNYITEIYSWNATSQSYELEDAYEAHIALKVPVHAYAIGKGYLSLYSRGDLHKYSSAYHPPDEKPSHVAALEGDSKPRVRVASGWGPLFLCGPGHKGLTATAKGTLITDTPNKYELKGKGKLDDHSGGESGSAGGVGGGTSPVSGSGGWVDDTTSFRVGVLDIRPSAPSEGTGSDPGDSGGDPGSESNDPPPADNTPNCPDCTSDCSSPCACSNSGTCGGTVSTPPSGSTPPSSTPPPGPIMVQCDNCSESYDSKNPDEVGYHRFGACYYTP